VFSSLVFDTVAAALSPLGILTAGVVCSRGAQTVTLVEKPEVTLPLNFQDTLPRQGVVDYIHERGYGFISDDEFPNSGPRIFMPPRVAAQFSRGDRVKFSANRSSSSSTDNSERVTEAAHAGQGELEPLFPPLTEHEGAHVSSKLLFSYAVNKTTRTVLRTSSPSRPACSDGDLCTHLGWLHTRNRGWSSCESCGHSMSTHGAALSVRARRLRRQVDHMSPHRSPQVGQGR